MSTNKKSLISVLVAIYNVEKYLPQCIDSILTQTYHNLEIVLVDDGSTDNSGKICDEYAAKDSRVKVIHKKNGGLVSARNAGLDVATGKYIGFVDGDDWIEPQTYQSALELIEKYQADIVKWGKKQALHKKITPIKLLGKPGVYEGKEITEVLVHIIKGDTVDPNIVSCLFKREIIERYKLRTPVGVDQGEDLYFITLYLLHTQRLFLNLQLYWYNYRQNPMSLTKRYSSTYFSKVEKLVLSYEKILLATKEPTAYLEAFYYRLNSTIFYVLFLCADFHISKIYEKIGNLKSFYLLFQFQLEKAKRYNTIPLFKRVPVILFHKQHFYLALAMLYCLKMGFKFKLMVNNIWTISL